MTEYYKTPTCPQAAQCGGCEWLAVPYPIQLERKRAALAELFAPTGVEPQEVVGMEEPLHYRAKAMTPYQPGEKGTLRHGMYKAGTHQLVACPSCLVEDPRARPILESIAQLCRSFRIKAYREDEGKGLLRHAVVRCAAETGQVMVTLVVNSKEFPHKKEFVKALREAHPEISTVVFNINTRDTNAVLGSREQVAYGQGWIEDRLCGQTFRIPSSAFYQTNPRQTERLYETAVELAGLKGGESVLDAYCGIGTIGIVAAKRCLQRQREGHPAGFHKKKAAKAAAKGKKAGKEPQVKPVTLVGVETTPAAVEIASENARINKVNGALFIQADAGAFLRDCGERFDVVFLDPPRAGVSEDFISGLLAARPKRVVYISCNPETQLRDIQALEGAYTLKRLVPVDMFPHTKHLETVALLVRAPAAKAGPAAAGGEAPQGQPQPGDPAPEPAAATQAPQEEE
ncbi:MAG: 23S rRNA (uracil(1939)-C(5))-methyltransferase RlmD [Coriobacteriales bacterium]